MWLALGGDTSLVVRVITVRFVIITASVTRVLSQPYDYYRS
jgi:hypothetical protein